MSDEDGSGVLIFPVAKAAPPGDVNPNEVDPVNTPPHYKQNGVEAIDIIEHIIQSYPDPITTGLVWQSLKYLIRAPHKGTLKTDLQKAAWYLNRAADR